MGDTVLIPRAAAWTFGIRRLNTELSVGVSRNGVTNFTKR